MATVTHEQRGKGKANSLIPNLAKHPNLSLSPACKRHCTKVFQLATKTSQPPPRYTESSPPTLPPFFLHSGRTHYLISPHALGEENHCGIFLVVVGRYYFVCMFSKASGHRQAHASVQQHCWELPSAQVAHCLGTLMKYSGFHLIAQNAPEIARSGGKVQCRR